MLYCRPFRTISGIGLQSRASNFRSHSGMPLGATPCSSAFLDSGSRSLLKMVAWLCVEDSCSNVWWKFKFEEIQDIPAMVMEGFKFKLREEVNISDIRRFIYVKNPEILLLSFLTLYRLTQHPMTSMVLECWRGICPGVLSGDNINTSTWELSNHLSAQIQVPHAQMDGCINRSQFQA